MIVPEADYLEHWYHTVADPHNICILVYATGHQLDNKAFDDATNCHGSQHQSFLNHIWLPAFCKPHILDMVVMVVVDIMIHSCTDLLYTIVTGPDMVTEIHHFFQA
jgi:hypothetical protein